MTGQPSVLADSPLPHRVQLRRLKGWRMPEGTVKVDRSTRWGNPFRATGHTPEQVVAAFRDWITEAHTVQAWDMRRDAQALLRGRNLACWCRLDQPCHADVLLDLANADPGRT